MCADPEPVVMTVPLASEGAVAAADFDSVDSTFLAKAQGGVPRIRLKQGEVFIGKLLNMRREPLVAFPERPQRV